MLAYEIARPSLRGSVSLSPWSSSQNGRELSSFFSGLTEAIMSETFGNLISVQFIDYEHSSQSGNNWEKKVDELSGTLTWESRCSNRVIMAVIGFRETVFVSLDSASDRLSGPNRR